MGRQEEDGRRKDDHQPRDDEAETADEAHRAHPRRRQAQRMASWVEAGPGSRLVTEIPSSNSRALNQPRSSDAEPSQGRDVGRRPPEASNPDPGPLAHDRGERNTLFDGLGHGRRGIASNGSGPLKAVRTGTASPC